MNRDRIETSLARLAVIHAGMISFAQAVEHSEISRYGALIEWANGRREQIHHRLLSGYG